MKDVFIKMKGMIALARLRKNRMWMLILTLLILCFVMPTGLGENNGIEYQINQTRYTNTSDILAKLVIALCGEDQHVYAMLMNNLFFTQ